VPKLSFVQHARVSAGAKLELLGLIDRAVGDGWAHARACRVLGLADVRAHRWRQRRRETGMLEDRDLQSALVTYDGPQDLVNALIADANHRGGLDNITAIVVRIDSLDSHRDDRAAATVAVKR